MKPWRVLTALLLASASIFGVFSYTPARADTAELQSQIASKTAELQKLQQEIAEYTRQLDTIGSARKTLETEIKRLDTERKKLATDIAITKNRIATTNLVLKDLAGQIADNTAKIAENRGAIAESLRSIGHLDDQTLAEQILAHGGLADAWRDIGRIAILQNALRSALAHLAAVEEALRDNQAEVTKEQNSLVSFNKELSGQKTVLDQNRATQAMVLTETKSKESTYQTLLEQKKSAAEALQNEINSYESQLAFTFDRSKIPSPGAGVLSFPLDPTFMMTCPEKSKTIGNIYCITQYFGNTAFAQAGAYNGAGHNGIDIGASQGTRVVSARTGTVVAIGNTDIVKGCYSFGKWILIKHDNGLASVYAHLSYVAVSAGQPVATGDFIGLSGQTGYATGPHLHFGLYVADAVKIVRLGDIRIKTNCANAVVPVAPTAAYLNPIEYL